MQVTHETWEGLDRPLAYKDVQGGERVPLSPFLS